MRRNPDEAREWPRGRKPLPGADEADRPSRSQKKRDSAALQELGERILRLPPAARRSLPLPESLRDAMETWGSLPSREAKRRQLQYIGRLVREEQEAMGPVLEALASME